MDNLDISLWQHRDLQFDDLPMHVKGFVCEQLKLPTIHAETLLSSPRMSVFDLVNMELPPNSSDRDAHYSNIPLTFSFFSPSQPINDIKILKQVILPPKGLVVKLLDQVKQSWLDGAESLALPGVSQNLPHCALHFWSELHLRVYPAHVSWEQALTWLQRDDLNLFQDQVHTTCEALVCDLVWQPSSSFNRPNSVHKVNSSQFYFTQMAIR